jgi:NAD(P)-dependent dehydrogenase (short-subunit alcohol dehydrogenase family)
MKLEGKTAVVTGGAAGIGLETCRRLVKEGCIVTVWDVDAKGLARARKDLSASGGKVFTYTCDVTKGARVAELARRAVKDMGKVDILVNNAGILVPGTFLEQPVEKWQKTVDVNLTSMLHTIHAFLPGMNKRGSGHVVNVSSAGGLLGVPGIAVYAATKWGVFGLTESLRHESWNAGKRGVKWSSIHPMYVRQGIFAGARFAGFGRLLVPEVRSHDEVAKAIVEYAIKRGRFAPLRPRSVKLTLVLRGLLPTGGFFRITRMLGVHHHMERWTGPKKARK